MFVFEYWARYTRPFYYMHHKQRLLKYLINKTYYYFERYTIFVLPTLNPDNMTQKVIIDYLLFHILYQINTITNKSLILIKIDKINRLIYYINLFNVSYY